MQLLIFSLQCKQKLIGWCFGDNLQPADFCPQGHYLGDKFFAGFVAEVLGDVHVNGHASVWVVGRGETFQPEDFALISEIILALEFVCLVLDGEVGLVLGLVSSANLMVADVLGGGVGFLQVQEFVCLTEVGLTFVKLIFFFDEIAQGIILVLD